MCHHGSKAAESRGTCEQFSCALRCVRSFGIQGAAIDTLSGVVGESGRLEDSEIPQSQENDSDSCVLYASY